MPKIKEAKEEKMVKIVRVDGQKLDRFMNCKFYQDNPDLYEKIVNYETIEINKDIAETLLGVRIVNDNKEKIDIEE